MVLVEHTAAGVEVKAVEINPDIPLLQQTEPEPAAGWSAPMNTNPRQAVDGFAVDDAIGPWPGSPRAVAEAEQDSGRRPAKGRRNR
ncbi:hypothetical protein ACFQ9X_37985 [Catenulispora yoronensis]